MFLDALKIVGESWPITLMVASLAAAFAVSRIAQTGNRASVEKKNIEAEKEIELKRLSFENGKAEVLPARRRNSEDY